MNIAIIGAGINGLYLSLKLAENGHKVAVLEKNSEIGNKVCSGLFSRRILKFIPESEKLIKNKINYALLRFPKKTTRINFSKEFLVMNHSELDKLVAAMARNRGVDIILNKAVEEIPFGFDKIIGCDGANSVVRQKLKLKTPKLRLGIQGFVIEKAEENFVETWPTKNGFLWRIPRGEKIEYGIIEEVLSAKKIFGDFLNKNKIKVENIGAKLIPQGPIIPLNSLITLCGDAAGLTKPWSGGGVVWGLKAADMLVESFPDFLAYRNKALKFFNFKCTIGKLATKSGVFIGFNAPYLLPKNITIESDFLF